MTLADYQFSLAGVVFGAGTVYDISNVTGFGLGDKRAKVFDNPGSDGVAWGREYRNGPTITFAGQVYLENDAAGAYAAIKTLRDAFNGSGTNDRRSPRTALMLGAKIPGQPEAAIQGRPDQFDVDLSMLAVGYVPFSATFVAAAPLSV